DHVLELTAFLADGSEVLVKDLTLEELELKCSSKGSEGRIYKEITDITKSHRQEILARYPKILRRVSGYNLDEFVKPQPINLGRIIVGSEGTLACVVEAKMRLVRKPKYTALDVIQFHEVWEALE
ncbi:MAG: FAD-binding oxidoreductase, partial [Deltaproteobacteria bacterium]|nr:FAD-binding oxidoreductase [Deltaproteobacteria bacterium]